jgi:predicted metal-dependent hydrolase
MAIKEYELPGIGQVKLVKRRGSKGLRISLSGHGGIRVTIPTWLPYSAGLQFVNSRREWILKHQPAKITALRNGVRIGKAHQLAFYSSDKVTRVTSRLIQNEARVTHPLSVLHTDPSVQKAAQRVAVKALTAEAEKLLPTRLSELAGQYGFTYKNVAVKRLSSRWGSCTQAGEITLNCFLMQLPWDLIDYVLLHELLHTKVLRHGKPFWDAFEDFLPNVAELRKKIRAFQPILLS